ncbi:hypothetical protein PV646_41115 [Streptomyces sp. ID05-26A]|nr:hypothetical protein [Streptomyces sp. ID05-26A]
MNGHVSKRWCRCGTQLSRDNRGSTCTACTKRLAEFLGGPPEVDRSFWDDPAISRALHARHMGQVVRAYRTHPDHPADINQDTVSGWLSMSQSGLSRLEAGKPIAKLDQLIHIAGVLAIPADLLWFKMSQPRGNRGLESQPALQVAYNHVRGVATATFDTDFGWFTAPPAGIVARVVGAADVATLRAMTRTFRQLDNRFGGGHARSTVSHYLVGEAAPLLRDGRFHEGMRRQLFGAVAELNQLAGWMAYDVGDLGSGRKHLRQALQLCQNVGDNALTAEMLAGLSHHAAFFRAPIVAVDLARAARDNAARTGIAALMAESAVMEAHGLALRHDTSGCLAALGDAEASFSSTGPDIPEWLRYFDAAYMAAKFAHCFRDLGRPKEAERFARRSLEMTDGYDRGRLFNTALLASILADQQRVEEACEVGTAALHMAGNMNSVRTVTYLKDIGRRLHPFRAEPAVQTLYVEMAAAGIVLSERKDVK